MFKKLFEKIVEAQDTYKDMRRERDIAVNKFRILVDEHTTLQKANKDYVQFVEDERKQFKKNINKIIKLVKTLDKNETTKEIKKILNEVKKIV